MQFTLRRRSDYSCSARRILAGFFSRRSRFGASSSGHLGARHERIREEVLRAHMKKIPSFKSEKAEREFWAKHDSAEYVDWNRARRIVSPEPPALRANHLAAASRVDARGAQGARKPRRRALPVAHQGVPGGPDPTRARRYPTSGWRPTACCIEVTPSWRTGGRPIGRSSHGQPPEVTTAALRSSTAQAVHDNYAFWHTHAYANAELMPVVRQLAFGFASTPSREFQHSRACSRAVSLGTCMCSTGHGRACRNGSRPGCPDRATNRSPPARLRTPHAIQEFSAPTRHHAL